MDGCLFIECISQALYNQVGNSFIVLRDGSKIQFRKEKSLFGVGKQKQLEGEIPRLGLQLWRKLRRERV